MNYAIQNTNSTLGENMKYFMYKYNISYEMFSTPVYNVLRKCDNFNQINYGEEDSHAVLITDLCMLRDSHQETNSEEIIVAINPYRTL